jgi:nicotinamide-nucleotide amidase
VPLAEILSQGDEVVTGQTVDSNAAWLSERLTEQGFRVSRHTTVGDRMDDLVAAFTEIGARADLCVCTGGLGPTDDDLTAEAVARAFDRPLALDEVALGQIEDRFRSFGRVMAPVNRKQALLPSGSLRLENSWGTAPGFALVGGRCFFACMPGVPREMFRMFEVRVLPVITPRFELQPGRRVTLRTFGIGESDLQQAMGAWSAPGVTIGYRTMMPGREMSGHLLPENQLKLWFEASVGDEELVARVAEVRERVGRWTFTIEGLPALPQRAPSGEVGPFGEIDTVGGTLAAVVGRLLAARGETLAVAESCTGGRVAAACTGIPGASDWFLEGVVAYANATKVRQLGVAESAITEHGAVSEPVARAMAEGLRARAGSTWGIGVTGIAGPGGALPDKPVGTVHVAVSGPHGTEHRALRLPGERDRVQSQAVAAALDLLRRELSRAGAVHASNTR